MNIALILAGGTGTRLGSDIPKQYIEVKGKPVIAYCVEKFILNADIDFIQIVADEMWHDYIRKHIDFIKIKGFSQPGKNRQLSIYNGLVDISKYACETDKVIIHDAARPCVSDTMIKGCIEKLEDYDGVIPVLPMKDTVYLSEDGKTISSMIPREKLIAGQAPEAFRLELYLRANERLLPDEILKINGSTEPAVMASMKVGTISGDEHNFKITTKSDLERFIEMAGG